MKTKKRKIVQKFTLSRHTRDSCLSDRFAADNTGAVPLHSEYHFPWLPAIDRWLLLLRSTPGMTAWEKVELILDLGTQMVERTKELVK